jgi:hypothetical protein
MSEDLIFTHEGEVVVHPPQQFYAGDTWQIQANCINLDGTPMDLASAAMTWSLNDASGQDSNFLVLTVNEGIVVDPATPPNGIAYITVTPAQSTALVAGFYSDQLVVVTSDGVVSTVFTGRIEVKQRGLMGPPARMPHVQA